jgi:RNA polymerase sigma-70 factor (ECF subfamily)
MAELDDNLALTGPTRNRMRLVRNELDKQIGPVLMDAFPFAGRRCERMTNAVLQRLILPK